MRIGTNPVKDVLPMEREYGEPIFELTAFHDIEKANKAVTIDVKKGFAVLIAVKTCKKEIEWKINPSVVKIWEGCGRKKFSGP